MTTGCQRLVSRREMGCLGGGIRGAPQLAGVLQAAEISHERVEVDEADCPDLPTIPEANRPHWRTVAVQGRRQDQLVELAARQARPGAQRARLRKTDEFGSRRGCRCNIAAALCAGVRKMSRFHGCRFIPAPLARANGSLRATWTARQLRAVHPQPQRGCNLL